ncbi:MAG: aminotransferase class I/II-fold pyridoxal phosphate-dependent enzyme [Geminicoccales bacterium]
MTTPFMGTFTRQTPLPDEAIKAAERIFSSGDLHRYQGPSSLMGDVALLEQEFADWQGIDYSLAVASGGQALQLALSAIGVEHGAPVLTNAFTLAPVPGAIRAVGGEPVLVDITEDLIIDLDHLTAMAERSAA